MTWDYDGWIVLIGVLVAVACALPGTWLVVRGMGLMGDAISHAVLPGIAVAFLVSGTRDSGWMFAGAAVAGVTAAVLTQVVHRWGGIERGAAMGIVFTTLFAMGLLLIVQTADSVDLDAGCVLHGILEMAPYAVIDVGGWTMPRIVPPLIGAVVVNIIVMVILYKELLMASFDPALSNTMGFPAGALQLLVMVLTAMTCVACFEAVGSIITVSLIVAPAATALLLAQRMINVLVLAAVIGAASAVLGHVAAVKVPTAILGLSSETSPAGTMAVMAAVIFAITAMVAPRRGVLSRNLSMRRRMARVAIEDALGLLFRLHERGEPASDVEVRQLLESDVRVGARRVRPVLDGLIRKRLAGVSDGCWTLTPLGRDAAAMLVRAHRLWETYLAGRSDIPSSHLHAAAERLEHATDSTLLEALGSEVNDSVDPHGRPIPPA